ncbi:hypothetical protein [Algoriphagus marincola]|nr:hypothetical protein [Algoriphagus marincola]
MNEEFGMRNEELGVRKYGGMGVWRFGIPRIRNEELGIGGMFWGLG